MNINENIQPCVDYEMVTIHSAIFHENASVMGKEIEDLVFY